MIANEPLNTAKRAAPSLDRAGPARYQLCVNGRLTARWAAWFEGFELRPHGEGLTCISGPVSDQAALHGLLAKLRDLGLPLVSLSQLDGATPPATSLSPDQPGATP